MGNLKAENAKIIFWRVLKIVSYFLGFLLLFHLIKKDSSVLTGQLGGVANKPVYYVLMAWGAVAIVQIVAGIILKKRIARAIVAAAIAVAVIATPLVYLEIFVEPEFEKLQEEFEAKGYEFDDYEDQVFDFADNISDVNEAQSSFLKYYNISYGSETYGGENTDMSDYYSTAEIKSKTDVDYIFGYEKGDADYSLNGMYADGYVFGYAQAKYILEVYNNTQKEYAAAGKDADVELDKAIAALTTNANSKWNKYKRTSAYTKFHGTDLDNVENAKRYYITEERLDAIIGVLGAKLSKTDMKTLIGMVAEFVPGLEGAGSYLSADLTLDQLLSLVNGFGIEIAKEDVLNLLEGYSNYQSPQTLPVFYFIENEGLRDYAYAKYFGEVHGAKVGSVLIGEMVGEVTMDNAGNEKEDIGERLASLDEAEYSVTYMQKYYPLLVLRENFFIFMGVIPASILLAYWFANNEKKARDRLIKKAREGGNK